MSTFFLAHPRLFIELLGDSFKDTSTSRSRSDPDGESCKLVWEGSKRRRRSFYFLGCEVEAVRGEFSNYSANTRQGTHLCEFGRFRYRIRLSLPETLYVRIH